MQQQEDRATANTISAPRGVSNLTMMDANTQSFLIEELEAAVAEAIALDGVGNDERATRSKSCVEVAASLRCDQFINMLTRVMLNPEIDLDVGKQPISLTILAPNNDAMSRLPQNLREDPKAMRTICEAHIVVTKAGSDGLSPHNLSLQSLQGTVHPVQLAEPKSPRLANAHRIGQINVTSDGQRPFRQGLIVPLDGILKTISATPVRGEQVWAKHVVPSPSVTIFGATGCEELEVLATLHYEHSLQECAAKEANGNDTKTKQPRGPLRGASKALPQPLRSLSPNHQEGGPRATSAITKRVVSLSDLVIDEKPPSQAKKGKAKGRGAAAYAASDEQQELHAASPLSPGRNMYLLAFHIRDKQKRVVASFVQPMPIKLCNSYHTVSEAEKEIRRQYNVVETDARQPELVTTSSSDGSSSSGCSMSQPAPLVMGEGDESRAKTLSDAIAESPIVRGGGKAAELAQTFLPPSSDGSLLYAQPKPPPSHAELRLNPNRGPCGTSVWLYCAGLSPFTRDVPRVLFGGHEASDIYLMGPGFIECKTPPLDLGALSEWPVTVTIFDDDGKELIGRELTYTYLRQTPVGSKRRVREDDDEQYADCGGQEGSDANGASDDDDDEEEEEEEEEEGAVRARVDLQLKRKCARLMETIKTKLEVPTNTVRPTSTVETYDPIVIPGSTGRAKDAKVDGIQHVTMPDVVGNEDDEDEDEEPAYRSFRTCSSQREVTYRSLGSKSPPAPLMRSLRTLPTSHPWLDSRLDAPLMDVGAGPPDALAKQVATAAGSKGENAPRQPPLGSEPLPVQPEGDEGEGQGADALPPLYTLLDTRDVSSGWNVVHYLAALGANKELAAVLSKPQCPLNALDPAGRSPLLLALLRGNGVAARLLLMVQSVRSLPWKDTWSALAQQPAGQPTVDRLASNLAIAGVSDEQR